MNWYCTRTRLLDAIAIGDSADNDQLDPVIEMVSRAIDEFCGRWFYPRVETRYASPTCSGELLLDADLLSVTALKTDEDGDRAYEVTWATTDYDLLPYGAPNGSVPRPYTEIAVAPNGAQSFWRGSRAVEIAGTWGYYDVRERSTATLGEDLDTTETSVDVSAGTAFEIGQTLKIDSEQMFVSGINTNTLTVTRGVNGTTAAAHANGAAIDVYQYPVIGQLALIQAAHVFRLKDVPGGMVGSSDLGGLKVAPGFHPIVYRALEPYRIRVFA